MKSLLKRLGCEELIKHQNTSKNDYLLRLILLNLPWFGACLAMAPAPIVNRFSVCATTFNCVWR